MFNNRYQQLLEEVMLFENKFYDPKMFQISLPSDKNIKIKELENWKNQLATDYSYNYFFANYTTLFIKIKNLFSDN